MTAPIHRIIEGLKQIELRVTPRALSKSGCVVREQEGKFLLEMVADARVLLEQNFDYLDGGT